MHTKLRKFEGLRVLPKSNVSVKIMYILNTLACCMVLLLFYLICNRGSNNGMEYRLSDLKAK